MKAAWARLQRGMSTVSAGLLLLLALIFATDVLFRYALGRTASWIVDLEWYVFAVALCLALGPALHRDEHVRVDVLFDRFDARSQGSITRSGHLLLLLPWCAFVVYAAGRYTYNSYLIGEGSPDPGGLPLRWAVKATLPLAFTLLGMEGLRQLVVGPPRRD